MQHFFPKLSGHVICKGKKWMRVIFINQSCSFSSSSNNYKVALKLFCIKCESLRVSDFYAISQCKWRHERNIRPLDLRIRNGRFMHLWLVLWAQYSWVTQLPICYFFCTEQVLLSCEINKEITQKVLIINMMPRDTDYSEVKFK